MRTNRHPYVECKNERCRRAIWLPRSSSLDKSLDRPDSDQPYFELYVCPVCVHAYGYRALNVHWQVPQADILSQVLGLSSVLLEFHCDQENPGILVIIEKPTTELRDVENIVKDSESWVLADVHCRNGHQIKLFRESGPGICIQPTPRATLCAAICRDSKHTRCHPGCQHRAFQSRHLVS